MNYFKNGQWSKNNNKPMKSAKISNAKREITIRTSLMSENQTMSWTIHRLQAHLFFRAIFSLADNRKHVIFIVIPMSISTCYLTNKLHFVIVLIIWTFSRWSFYCDYNYHYLDIIVIMSGLIMLNMLKLSITIINLHDSDSYSSSSIMHLLFILWCARW